MPDEPRRSASADAAALRHFELELAAQEVQLPPPSAAGPAADAQAEAAALRWHERHEGVPVLPPARSSPGRRKAA